MKEFDSNATDIDIDPSCLDALDDQLLASPIASFLDVCWAEAVGAHEADLNGESPILYNAPIPDPPKVFDNKFDNYHDLDPLSPDNEKWYDDYQGPVKADIKYVCIDIQGHERPLSDLCNRSEKCKSCTPLHPRLVSVNPR
jgi:hypothetical protein